MIRESFSIIGQYPYSLNQVLSQCTTKFSSEQELSINANMDNLSKKFMKQGRLVTKDFQDLQIMPKSTVYDKDELISSRQRSMLLTHKQLNHMLTKKAEAKQLVQEKSLARKASKKRKKDDGEIIKKKRAKFGDTDDEDEIDELYEI
jgi:hypothetical protein